MHKPPHGVSLAPRGVLGRMAIGVALVGAVVGLVWLAVVATWTPAASSQAVESASPCAVAAPEDPAEEPESEASCGDPGSLAGTIICIDPGHPSEVSLGTASAEVTENHINWVIAQRLAGIVRSHGAEVVMTKAEEDLLVTNRARAEIANEAGADLFIRLHCDARPGRGTATYFPDQQGTTGDGVTGPCQEVIDSSRAIAEVFHPAMIAAMGEGWHDMGVLGDSRTAVGSRQGALTGSIFAEVPVITVEMISLTNADDAAFILVEENQDKLAHALAKGIIVTLGGSRSPAPSTSSGSAGDE